MSKARDEYTNQCKSTHHIRPLALVEVVIGIIQFTTQTNLKPDQYFISCILNFFEFFKNKNKKTLKIYIYT